MKRLIALTAVTSCISFLFAAETADAVARPDSNTVGSLDSNIVTRPDSSSDSALKVISVDELEVMLFDEIQKTGTGKMHAPIAVKAQERLASYRQAKIAEPNNRLLPQMLRTAEILVNAAISEARGLQLQRQLDSLLEARIAAQAEIRAIQNQIIQHEQKKAARLKGTLAANEQMLDEERRRAAEYSQLMAKEQARAAQYSQLADEERLKAVEAEKLAEQERLKALEAERVADSLRIEAKKRQEEARNKLNALQSKLIQVTQDARGIILSMSDILFAVNKADLTPDLQQNLAKIAGILTVYKESKIIVEGHTDNTGSAEHNQKLSETRANNVRNYLIKMGLEKNRLRAVGYGLTKPVANNSTAEGRQKNRRVDIVISDSQLN
jgi:outer membrane protein OmpA-like peptidoglycan-associated protein